eukprot:g2801.t1
MDSLEKLYAKHTTSRNNDGGRSKSHGNMTARGSQHFLGTDRNQASTMGFPTSLPSSRRGNGNQSGRYSFRKEDKHINDTIVKDISMRRRGTGAMMIAPPQSAPTQEQGVRTKVSKGKRTLAGRKAKLRAELVAIEEEISDRLGTLREIKDRKKMRASARAAAAASQWKPASAREKSSGSLSKNSEEKQEEKRENGSAEEQGKEEREEEREMSFLAATLNKPYGDIVSTYKESQQHLPDKDAAVRLVGGQIQEGELKATHDEWTLFWPFENREPLRGTLEDPRPVQYKKPAPITAKCYMKPDGGYTTMILDKKQPVAQFVKSRWDSKKDGVIGTPVGTASHEWVPRVGRRCMARDDVNREWYLATVLAIDGKQLDVKFMSRGNKRIITVQRHNVKPVTHTRPLTHQWVNPKHPPPGGRGL